jgi:hypothetical protein
VNGVGGKSVTIVAVKKYTTKKGKRYGPYPKDPDLYYLYEVYRENGKVKQKYLGVGPKPEVVSEKT